MQNLINFFNLLIEKTNTDQRLVMVAKLLLELVVISKNDLAIALIKESMFGTEPVSLLYETIREIEKSTDRNTYEKNKKKFQEFINKDVQTHLPNLFAELFISADEDLDTEGFVVINDKKTSFVKLGYISNDLQEILSHPQSNINAYTPWIWALVYHISCECSGEEKKYFKEKFFQQRLIFFTLQRIEKDITRLFDKVLNGEKISLEELENYCMVFREIVSEKYFSGSHITETWQQFFFEEDTEQAIFKKIKPEEKVVFEIIRKIFFVSSQIDRDSFKEKYKSNNFISAFIREKTQDGNCMNISTCGKWVEIAFGGKVLEFDLKP